MKSLQEYLDDAAIAHGHLCAGQVLGVRMAMFGLKKFGWKIHRARTASAS